MGRAPLGPHLDSSLFTFLVQWSFYKYKIFVGWRVRVKVQISRKKLHTHIHLDDLEWNFYLICKNKYKTKTYIIFEIKQKQKNSMGPTNNR